MISLPPDWSAFLRALISRRTRFLLIGGHAVAAHAEARFTDDLDVFVEPTLANARRLRAALTDFGFGSVVPTAAELAKRNQVLMLGRKPLRIDILTGIDGVSFPRAWKGRVSVDFEGGPLYVIGRAELIANKRAAGRTKDQFDLALLAKYGRRSRLRQGGSSR
jgi:predicted nucleotidyltransferase